jgi:hypothetical protein
MKAAMTRNLALLALMASSAIGNPANQQLMNWDVAKQHKALKMVLTGERCDTVTNATYDGSDKKDNAFWSVQCADGNSYLLEVRNDAVGTTMVLDCGMSRLMKIHVCFTKMKPEEK